MFRVFRDKRPRNFSAVQTAWRRGRHSNPRYRSETCKSRRVRKLHGIKSFRDSPRLRASRAVVANRWGFPKEFESESLAILWLKVVTSKLLNRPCWVGV